MQQLLVASYALTCVIYLWLFIWLVVRGLIRTNSQRAFATWILFLALTSMSGTIWYSSSIADTALLLSRVNSTVLMMSALTLWFFSILFSREARPSDMLTFVPAFLTVPIVWTLMIPSVEFGACGFNSVISVWFVPYMVVLYGYYLASAGRIFQVLMAVRKTRSHASLLRIWLLFWSVLTLVVMEILMPISCRILEITWLESLIVLGTAAPPLLIAFSFYMGEEKGDYSR